MPLNPSSTFRRDLPGHILSILPVSLVFPVAWMYVGFLLFLLAFVVSGEWTQKWQRVRQHPMLLPTLLMLGISSMAMLLHGTLNTEGLNGFLHYQIYFFLLVMLAVSPGDWQQRAVHSFFLGALIAASLFFLASLKLLPETTLFRSYVIYQGNKSILLGLLLAIAAVWMLHEWKVQHNHTWWRLAAFLYVVLGLFIGSKSRTAGLLFFVLVLMLGFAGARMRRWYLLALACLAGLGAVTVYQAAQQAAPVTCLAKEMHDRYQMSGVEILENRAICTVQQVRDFGKSGNVSEDGMRLQIYHNTWELVQQSPWTGHGVSQWLPLYQEKAKGSMSEKMTTPHNDYLLYWCELGIAGVVGLLLTFVWQFRVGVQLAKQRSADAIPVYLLSLSMMFAGAFNAILRDALFGLAMLILLAIPMASFRAGQRP
ncbi:O-antigen ligase family protein [Undibacterium cyanobacteriorum]|uniref:O-antigen ligase family protein n=1 Tax=Undibacterium cyanobacteriorum TaxID=3073561 RepID=A0ABY9REY6_9BURK|nr:O-antigen ligase family protein [Undibacterium sp. 20NA77.5]WMW79792.1 O-antigen ligase family protein [Undibacterium sp. 20NA77.5]